MTLSVSPVEIDCLLVLNSFMSFVLRCCNRILHVSLGILAKIHHQFLEHVADNLDILIADLLPEFLQTSFDDVSIQMLGSVQFCDQVHVAVHLFSFPLLELFVIEEVHHRLGKICLILFFQGLRLTILTLSLRIFLFLAKPSNFRHRVLPLLPFLPLPVEHFEELLLTLVHE